MVSASILPGTSSARGSVSRVIAVAPDRTTGTMIGAGAAQRRHRHLLRRDADQHAGRHHPALRRGGSYFTDPTFGSGSQGFPSQTLSLSNAQGVYRLTTDGVVHLEDATTSGPNGVNLSPDEKTLYVSYTLTGTVSKFTVAADGSLSGKTTFATGATVADSMCVDAGGNVYVGTLSGLAVYDPSGAHLGTISAGGNIVTNCAFGGADQRTLYITARARARRCTARRPRAGAPSIRYRTCRCRGYPGQN